jgi:hypothetical protein
MEPSGKGFFGATLYSVVDAVKFHFGGKNFANVKALPTLA